MLITDCIWMNLLLENIAASAPLFTYLHTSLMAFTELKIRSSYMHKIFSEGKDTKRQSIINLILIASNCFKSTPFRHSFSVWWICIFTNLCLLQEASSISLRIHVVFHRVRISLFASRGPWNTWTMDHMSHGPPVLFFFTHSYNGLYLVGSDSSSEMMLSIWF